MTSPYLTMTEAISYLRMDALSSGDELVRRYIRSGKLKACKRGKIYMFKQSQLDDFLRMK